MIQGSFTLDFGKREVSYTLVLASLKVCWFAPLLNEETGKSERRWRLEKKGESKVDHLRIKEFLISWPIVLSLVMRWEERSRNGDNSGTTMLIFLCVDRLSHCALLGEKLKIVRTFRKKVISGGIVFFFIFNDFENTDFCNLSCMVIVSKFLVTF